MRTFYVLLVLISLTCISCRDGGDNNSFEFYFELNGTQYEVKNGYFLKGAEEFIIILMDGTIINNTLATDTDFAGNLSGNTKALLAIAILNSELEGSFALSDIRVAEANAECSKIADDEFDCDKNFFLDPNANSDGTGMISIIETDADYDIKFELTDGDGGTLIGDVKMPLIELTINTGKLN